MRRHIYIFIGGFIAGAISMYIFEKKKQKLLKRIEDLETKLKNISMKDNLKVNVKTVLAKLKFSLKNDKNLTEIEKDMILKEVRERILEIEESISRWIG